MFSRKCLILKLNIKLKKNKLFQTKNQVSSNKNEKISSSFDILSATERTNALIEKYKKSTRTTTTTASSSSSSTKMDLDHQESDVIDSLDLMDVITRSNSQTLEANIFKRLDSTRSGLSHDQDSASELNLLAESIFKFENRQQQQQQHDDDNEDDVLTQTHTQIQKSQRQQQQSVVRRQFSVANYERSVVDVLLDLYSRCDPQIVRKNQWHGIETEFRLLFEQRQQRGRGRGRRVNDSTPPLTQSFLLALFIHQANWTNLFDCIQYLLDSKSIFSKLNNTYS